MADVSQVVQMQRLRASAARRPVKNDKSITHLYQPQITSSGISEFLPNSKTKNTDGRTIKSYHYVPGKHAKPKVPPRNTYGSGVSSVIIPSPINFVNLAGMDFLTPSIYSANVFNVSTIPTIFRISFINVDPSIQALARIRIESPNLTSTDTVSFSNPTYNPVAVFVSGQITFIAPSTLNAAPNITSSTILTVTTTNKIDDFVIYFGNL